MTSLNIVMWNCGGVRPPAQSTPDKLDFVANNFDKLNFSVLALVETHLKQSDSLPDKIKLYSTNYHFINEPTPSSETHAGILVLVHKDFDIVSTNVL